MYVCGGGKHNKKDLLGRGHRSRDRWCNGAGKYYSLSESSEAIEERLERPKLGGPLTSDVVPNSLYHPITMLERFRSSSMI